MQNSQCSIRMTKTTSQSFTLHHFWPDPADREGLQLADFFLSRRTATGPKWTVAQAD